MASRPADRGASLIEHVADLRTFSSGLLALAELCPERMTVAQSTFFLFAGLADLSGKPSTFTELRELVGETMSRSLHTTYKVFLAADERESRREQALGWLLRETDRADNRRKYLRLTKEGRSMMAQIIRAMTEDARRTDIQKTPGR